MIFVLAFQFRVLLSLLSNYWIGAFKQDGAAGGLPQWIWNLREPSFEALVDIYIYYR